MSRLYVSAGTRTVIPARGAIPPFVLIEDEEHTVRCVMAIRARKRLEGMGVVTPS